jgi:hypothetical protein
MVAVARLARLLRDNQIDILVSAIGTAIFASLALAHDIIAVRGGLGFDGADYARMLVALGGGSAATRIRPMVVLANRPAYLVTKSAVFSFALMNHVYAFMLWYQLCHLYKRIDPRPLGRLLLVVTLSLCIATSKMFAYYPVLVDLGAYAFMAWAVQRILRGPGIVTAVAVAAAMLSREFGVAVAAFGIHRYVRLRMPRDLVASTFGPGVALLAGTAVWSAGLSPPSTASIFSPANLSRTVQLWNDPVFVAFFLYFAVTVFGGISVVLAARSEMILRVLREEPEWLTFSAPILLAATLGDADIWRYLAYTLPAAVVIYATCASEWSMRRLIAVSLFSLALTLVLENPFRAMTVPEYFRRWFPYYVVAGKVPVADRLPLLPVWTRLFVTAAIGLLAMPLLARTAGIRKSTEADRARMSV